METKHMQLPKILHRRLLIDDPPASDDFYAVGGGGGGGDDEFDTNMVIILSFLLCALLFAIGLNVFARCGLLHTFRNSSTEQPAAPGLKKHALRRLPVAVYGSRPDFSTEECAICLGEFLDGERIRVLPKCGHGFHVACIDTWLVSHASCPNCRASLLERRRPPPPPSTDREAGSDQLVAVDISGQVSSC